MEDNIKTTIENLITHHKVFLFMKGTPDSPACGFSARAVSLLKANGVDINSIGFFNVLTDEEIRQGIKDFSSWPTVPQLYVNAEFIGGSDIMMEMHTAGELELVLV